MLNGRRGLGVQSPSPLLTYNLCNTNFGKKGSEAFFGEVVTAGQQCEVFKGSLVGLNRGLHSKSDLGADIVVCSEAEIGHVTEDCAKLATIDLVGNLIVAEPETLGLQGTVGHAFFTEVDVDDTGVFIDADSDDFALAVVGDVLTDTCCF